MNVIISADDQGHNSVSCVSGPCIMRYEVVWAICRDQNLNYETIKKTSDKERLCVCDMLIN